MNHQEEIIERQTKELAAMQVMTIDISPEKGYTLAAVVQAASICIELPETTQAFCKEFVNGFCDRYREQMPTVVKELENAWQDPQLMTSDEFKETLGEKWQRIAKEVEAEMNGEVKIIVDGPRGALCPVDGEPCSKNGNFYYYPGDCPDYGMCDDFAQNCDHEYIDS